MITRVSRPQITQPATLSEEAHEFCNMIEPLANKEMMTKVSQEAFKIAYEENTFNGSVTVEHFKQAFSKFNIKITTF